MEVINYLQTHEAEIWQWSASVKAQEAYAEEIRLQLLKETYRLEYDAHPEVAEACARVAERLGLAVPVTLYQSGGNEMNAMLCYLPGEAHVILTGPILNTMTLPELEAVLAHELAHYHLWEVEGGQFHIADRLLTAIASDVRSTPAQLETVRRYRLYTEIYADRGSLVGCGDLDAAVAALVKVQTGLNKVNAQSYLRQAEEIFAKDSARTEGVTHPEVFTRARALRLWAEDAPALNEWLAATIETPLALNDLDLIGQGRLMALTRRLLQELLRPTWFQSDLTLAHARQFFDDYVPSKVEDQEILKALPLKDPSTREYLTYLLLDFAAADPALEELPLAHTLLWSEKLGVAKEFEKLVVKDLGIAKRQWGRIKKSAAELVTKAEAVAHE